MNILSTDVVLVEGGGAVLTTRAPLEGIRTDGGTQSRVCRHDPATVVEYAEVVRAGGQLPAIVVFEDGADIWLADGFHRLEAHKVAGADTILCEVHLGTLRDAILYSLGANAKHGLRRTNEDKRRAVSILLADEDWSKWSDREIARVCGVSNNFVGDVRRAICVPNTGSATNPICHRMTDSPTTRSVERNGVTYQQNTANIGKVTPKGELAPTAPTEMCSSLSTSSPAEMRPNLDTSSAAVPHPTADEIRTKSPAPAAGNDDGLDLAQLADELQRENESYQRQIQSLEADDPKAELVRLNLHLDQLNGRLQGEITTRNEAQKMVKHYAGLLERIRKVLKVESNRDILSALEAR